MLVEPDVLEGLCCILLVCGMVCVDQMLDLAALEQMLCDNLVDILRLHAAVECAFRIDDDNRTGLTKSETSCADDLDFLIKTVLLDLLIETLDQRRRSGG